jgi:hypothetical protein
MGHRAHPTGDVVVSPLDRSPEAHGDRARLHSDVRRRAVVFGDRHSEPSTFAFHVKRPVKPPMTERSPQDDARTSS